MEEDNIFINDSGLEGKTFISFLCKQSQQNTIIEVKVYLYILLHNFCLFIFSGEATLYFIVFRLLVTAMLFKIIRLFFVGILKLSIYLYL